MMTNLFSAFDPATSKMMSLNWISTIMVIILIPTSFWLLPSKPMIIKNKMIEALTFEFKLLLGPSSKGFTLLSISLFTYIMINNMMGLLPYIFTGSSHMTFTLTLALPLWLSLMLYGWINHMNSMFSHLVPTGTPSVLMPFMVIIETLSNLIRPGALAVRLMANMIAGHLLMSLLGNNMTNATNMIPFILMVQMLLMMFESAVAVIQAYVFSVLMTLYTSELP
uniref:ATP synthase subunit a n=1 Tax=Antilochus coquebertii TaxID=1577200 RepID=A0A4Y1JW26_9HEMI|nr:ATP synthase F0 subunit 6 [Antilochus coquebertii]APO08966.1 ATP synthase F0 subunit 6 [Antilochus coquebertii]